MMKKMKIKFSILTAIILFSWFPNMAYAHKGSTYTCENTSRIEISNNGNIIKLSPRPAFIFYHNETELVIRYLGWDFDKTFKKNAWNNFNEVTGIAGYEMINFWVMGRDNNDKIKLIFQLSTNDPYGSVLHLGECLEN